MRFRQRVAFQEPTETRGTSGTPLYTYETVAGYESLAATILPWRQELRLPDLAPDEERFDVILGGHWPDIETTWVILDGESVYEVVEVRPTLRHRETVVVARRVAV